MTFKIGDSFEEKYEIEAVLGSGGVGTVYKALQLDCNRTVALKILHHHLAMDEEFQARFVREAQALGKLSHVNIVNVYQLGVSKDGMPYLVIEFVKGQTVRGRLNALDRLPVLQALRIAGDTARAMSCVHRHDLIHCDLKPENIILTQLPDADTIKIVDFALREVGSINDAVKALKFSESLLAHLPNDLQLEAQTRELRERIASQSSSPN